MNEDFLYYLWEHRLVKQHSRCRSGCQLKVINPGIHNMDSGPDFLDARIMIEDTYWAGNVEVHVNASDWFRHGHDNDPSYDNIILHVVYNDDVTVKRRNNEIIPVYEVRNNFNENLLTKYKQFISSLYWVPCQGMIKGVNKEVLNIWLERVLVERLERKSFEVNKLLESNKGDWEQTFYQLLSKNFGFRVNSTPFELLAQSISLKTLVKHCDELFQIEALLFGQAGFLDTTFMDDYPNKLKKEYQYLRKKYIVESGNRFLWRFLRLRPSNFPTLRIAQLSSLIFKSPALLTSVLECENLEMIFRLFDVKASSYWDDHYRFDCRSVKKEKRIGKDSMKLFVINTIVPVVFLYGKNNDLRRYQNVALDFLANLKPERNNVIMRWRSYGIEPDSSSQTQALLELKSRYCNNKRCLHCAIGNYLLQR